MLLLCVWEGPRDLIDAEITEWHYTDLFLLLIDLCSIHGLGFINKTRSKIDTNQSVLIVQHTYVLGTWIISSDKIIADNISSVLLVLLLLRSKDIWCNEDGEKEDEERCYRKVWISLVMTTNHLFIAVMLFPYNKLQTISCDIVNRKIHIGI